MGMTVLYIAFGMVALWLLGEVLLQYKARLRWRLLAFVGFLSVVVGVVMPSIVVIVIGAVAFAVGQTYVTLSFRRGFTTGWALGGKPGASRRRRGDPGVQDPTLQVSDVEYEPVEVPEPHGAHDRYDDTGSYGTAGSYDDTGAYEATGVHDAVDPSDTPPGPDQPHAAADGSVPMPPEQPPTQVYEPEPLPEDTGQYGVYTREPAYGSYSEAGGAGYGSGYGDSGYDNSGYDNSGYDNGGYDNGAYDSGYGYPQAAPAGTAAHASAPAQQGEAGGAEYGYGGYATAPGQQQYGHDTGQAMYASWVADPYAGGAAAQQDGMAGAQVPGTGHQQYDAYGQQGYPGSYRAQDPYAGGTYGTETPPGGVWMPQQRGTEDGYGAELPPEQPYPYQGHPQGAPDPAAAGYDPTTGYDPGYRDQQHRY